MKKRTDLLVIITVMILISITTISLFVNKYGFIKIDQQIIRLAFTFTLSYFLYLEKQWARWLTVVLLFLGGIAGIVATSSLLKSYPIASIILAIMSLFYLSSATYLAFIRKWENKS